MIERTRTVFQIALLTDFSIRQAQRTPRRVPEQLPFTDVSHVAALVGELHHAFALASFFRPFRTGVRILLDAAEAERLIVEVDRPQPLRSRRLNPILSPFQLHPRSLVDEHLTPDFNQGVTQRLIHRRSYSELTLCRGLWNPLKTNKSRFLASLSRNNMSNSCCFWYIGGSGQRPL